MGNDTFDRTTGRFGTGGTATAPITGAKSETGATGADDAQTKRRISEMDETESRNKFNAETYGSGLGAAAKMRNDPDRETKYKAWKAKRATSQGQKDAIKKIPDAPTPVASPKP